MRDDFYETLGVPRDEPARGIRKAFRDLARRLRPERGMPWGTRELRRTLRAYEVLASPEARALYDRGALAPSPPPFATPDERALSLLALEGLSPSPERAGEILRESFGASSLPKSGRTSALSLHVELEDPTPVLFLAVPVYRPCAACHGARRTGSLLCLACGGEGVVEDEEDLRVEAAAARAPEGAPIDLRELGIATLHLDLHVHGGRPSALRP